MPLKKLHTLVENITLPNNYSLQKEGISQSLLGAWQSCPQRFLFMVNRWIKIDGDAVFEFGNIYHEMLDQSSTAGKAPSKSILKGRLKRYAKKREHELSANALESFGEKIELAGMILEEYFKYYPEDFAEKTVIKAEQLFEVEFNGVVLRGKKDLRFYFNKNPNQIWLKEIKTKGRIDADILEGVLNFDLQNLFYILADDIEYNDDVKFVLYDIIRNPGHKRNANETFQQYVDRIHAHIIKEPEHFFVRYECPYTLNTKKRFKKELIVKLNLLQLFLSGKIPFYRNECACHTPYKCQYLDACASGNMVGYKQQDLLFPELGK